MEGERKGGREGKKKRGRKEERKAKLYILRKIPWKFKANCSI